MLIAVRGLGFALNLLEWFRGVEFRWSGLGHRT